jgi:L-2-hydroxyglutarate oxidase LhgO
MADPVECVVVGAGVVGLAIARTLAMRGYETLVLESAAVIGSGVSSRSSEVIHAGIYYANDSLKARLCVRGRELLYAYCRERAVAHRACGKLIVAADAAQSASLAALLKRAARNGVSNLRSLGAADVAALEPELRCHAALHSPSTGIVDSHGLMLALQADLESAGGVVVHSSTVIGGRCATDGIHLMVGGASTQELTARVVVNAAGLGAQAVARSLTNFPHDTVPALHFAKGRYFVLSGQSPFTHLVYPVPEPGGLGIHLTLDLAGRARFGPDVAWVEQPDYDVDARLADSFATAIRRYWPGLPDRALLPGYAGVRPKLALPGAPPADFAIHAPRVHGIEGLVNLYGIESPGLTSALAIAEYVNALV